MPESLYDKLGGEPKLHAIVRDFVDRVFADVMIGFFFAQANKARVVEFEFQHAARALGADVQYQGRPLRQTHARFPIMGGHFARRLQILRETLEAHAAPPEVIEAWIAHNESLRDQITDQPDGQCID